MAEVEIRAVSKAFGQTQAVSDLSLTVADGEFVALLGPTGAGKTTTLRLIAGLEMPDRGSIRIGGRDVTGDAPADRDVAFVFQQYSLYPHLTVFENMAFALRAPIRRVPEAEIRAKVLEVAHLLHIETKLDNKATQLSGGQMQRVAIGRALVRSPSIYLMDEPLSSLDAKLRGEMRLELKRIQTDLGATILYVTHDQTEAMTMASRIGVIEAGRLMQIGTPARDLREPGQRLCRRAARAAGDQPAARGSVRRRAARRQDHRRADRAPDDRARRRRCVGNRHADRASRRPEPSASRSRRPARRDLVGSRGKPRRRRRRVAPPQQAAVLRCGRREGRGMTLDRAAREKLVRALAGSMIEHADELTGLDQAIGDGDHGLNMKRGFEAVLATLPGLADKSLPEMLKAIGMTLVMKVGGASGPLVGTFFMELGKALPEQPARADLVAATDKAIDAVKARGRSDAGQKTLLDVLVPVQAVLADGGDARAIATEAAQAADRTTPMLAIRGRASFLGERSIGHMDPGSRSVSLLIGAAVATLELEANT